SLNRPRCLMCLSPSPAFRAHILWLAAVALVAQAASPAPAQVVTSTWTGASGNWTSPALWAPAVPRNGVPNPTDRYNALVDGLGTIAVDTPIAIELLNFPRGAIDVLNGTLSVNGNGTASGAFTIAPGAGLQFNPAGGYTFSGSTITLAAGAALQIN